MTGRDDIAFLMEETVSSDTIGNQTVSSTEKQVYVTVESISQSEHYAAAQLGFQPDYKLTVSEFDYSGEKHVRFHASVYSVYRTFLRVQDEKMELYLRQEGGAE